MNIEIEKLSARQLKRAAGLKQKIESLQSRLSRILGTQSAKAAQSRKYKMTATGRAKIAAAQRARWAKAEGKKSVTKPARKPRRKISASARAKISAAAKTRWAKAKAAGHKTLKGA